LRKRTLLAAFAAAIAMALPAEAQEWPTRPVKLVVNYPAGGSMDAISRPWAEALAKRLGQPVVVENRAGAAGALGTEVVAKAAPDGYTLLASPNGPLVLLPALRKMPYQPTDVTPVGPMGDFVYGIAVLPKHGFKTMADLMAFAKAHPGKLSYSSPGAGSATHLRGEALKLVAGVDMLHVPYRTGAEALIDFLGGTVDVIIDNVMFPHVRAGQATLLAVTSDRRFPAFPDVPTVMEAGYDVKLANFAAIFVPKATPQAIKDKLARVIADANTDPVLQQRVLQVGFFPTTKTGAELAAEMDGQVAEYQDWVKKTGLKIE
jgi:tripartite-type tricarboxylate transporter receptor subunit TctC